MGFRIFALSCGLSLFAFSFALAQEETPPSERRLTLVGSMDIDFVSRTRPLNEALVNLNRGFSGAAALSYANDHFALGHFDVTFHANLDRNVEGVVELQNRTLQGDRNGDGFIDPADNVRLGDGTLSNTTPEFRQAFVKLNRFLGEPLSLKVGAQDLSYRLRPQGEPFFLDLGEAEPMFAQVNTAGTQIRNVVTRETTRPVGLKARWDSGGAWAADAFVMRVLDDGDVHHRENLEGLFFEAVPFYPLDRLSVMLMATHVGSELPGSSIFTVGGGIDAYPVAALELFGEAYVQGGKLTDDIDKRGAYAFYLGARFQPQKQWWLEGSYWFLSGDKDPFDGHDSAFQSYENVNQFALLEDKEIGLNFNTNYNAVKLSGGVGPFPLGKQGGHWLAQADVGFFRLDEPLFSPSGVQFVGSKNLGTELDIKLTWEYTDAVGVTARGAFLFGSGVLEELTTDGTSHAEMFTLGINVRF